MATISLDFNGQPDKTPYLTSDHPNGANFTSRGVGAAAVFSNAWYGNNASANTVWSCDIDPAVNTYSLQVVMDTADSNSRGVVVFNSSGNGFMFIARNNDVRVFALAAWALSGTALATYATTFTTGGVLNVDVTQNIGQYVVKNGSTILGTYTNTTYTSGLKGGLVARGGGRIRSFTLTYTPAYSINTFTDPLIPNAAASGTQTGFADGAITANFGGITFTGTISGSTISGTVSGFIDNTAIPFLPATNQNGIFTQGANTANLSRNISLQNGYRETRDLLGNPASLNEIVLGDYRYLGQPFVDAGNPLTNNDRIYWLSAYGLIIGQDTGILLNAPDHPTNPVPSLPYVTTIFVHRGSDGKIYSHTLTISESGAVSVSKPSVTISIGIGLGFGI